MRVSSSAGAAQDAVSRFSGVRVESPGQSVSVASSNIASITAGAVVANQVLHDLSRLVSTLQGQSGKVTDLATALEQRDSDDAGTWTWDV